ncbi:MAG TPA: RNA 2',3'-cyclic phosphodiesterase [Mycobacterium sp.]|nr:RNA 2',3'-cyclic phosphodiesterase [Mycobacterium sp.]
MAVPISAELRAALLDYVAELRASPWADDWRWTDPAGWHITLAFLGSISPSAVPDIAARVEEVAARHVSFTVEIGSLSAFPSLRRPRVLWIGVHDSRRALEQLAWDLRRVFGLPVIAPFVGHVTLARSRGAPIQLVATSAQLQQPFSTAVVEVRLYRSEPGNGTYSTLHSAGLPS